MDISNVAFKPLLAHIAVGLAAEYVQQVETASASSEAIAGEQEEREDA